MLIGSRSDTVGEENADETDLIEGTKDQVIYVESKEWSELVKVIAI